MTKPNNIGNWAKILDLGSGGFGVVSLWSHQITSERIAIKMCKFLLKDNLTPRQRERWMDEVQIMKSLKHPNIIKFIEVPEELAHGLNKMNPTKLPLLSMEYCDKGNLRHILKDLKNGCGLKEPDVREILEDIGSACSYLHDRNITHRDIKPDNIVLKETDSRKSKILYKLIDLGYAKDLDNSVVSFVGTLDYLAPEIFRHLQYNYSVDYWSFGTLTFEIICGVVPFLPGRSIVERYDKVNAKDKDVICIYEDNASGSFRNSNEILKYHHISSCFKTNIEVWLRHVLQYDPGLRSQNIFGMSVFQHLKEILDTRVLNVFWLYKLQSFSYSIDATTSIGTLKEWIVRDTNTNPNDILILFSKNVSDIPNEKCVVNYLTENNIVYVVHKNSFFDNPQYNTPYFVKQLFAHKWNFENREVKKVCSHCVYYLTKESNTIVNVKKSINLYRLYIKNLCQYTKGEQKISNQKFDKLLRTIEEISGKFRDNNLRIKEENQGTLIKLMELLKVANNLPDRRKVLKSQLQTEWSVAKKLVETYTEIDGIMRECDFDKHLNGLVKFIEQSSPQKDDFFGNITKQLGDALKTKDSFLHNSNLKKYYNDLSRLLNNLMALFYEMSQLDELSSKLYGSLCGLSINEEFFTKNQHSTPIIPLINGIKDLKITNDDLIEENKKLRNQWDIIVNNIFCNDMFLDRF